jgi:hypothetical protein
MALAPTDQELVRELREAGVLQDVDGHRLNQSNGIILVCCADGDQMPDIWQFQSGIMQRQRQTSRIHTLSLNGGALLIPEGSMLNAEAHEDIVLLKHIHEAITLKGIHTIALYAHGPCGAAGLTGLTLIEVIGLLKQAGKRVREAFPGAQAVCFFHADKGETKRTYFVSARWFEWLAQRQTQDRITV